jgi:hypothetical protein
VTRDAPIALAVRWVLATPVVRTEPGRSTFGWHVAALRNRT